MNKNKANKGTCNAAGQSRIGGCCMPQLYTRRRQKPMISSLLFVLHENLGRHHEIKSHGRSKAGTIAAGEPQGANRHQWVDEISQMLCAFQRSSSSSAIMEVKSVVELELTPPDHFRELHPRKSCGASSLPEAHALSACLPGFLNLPFL